jgi:hypothetical protein
MTTIKVCAMPSPNLTNNEKLFIVQGPKGTDARGAFDAVMKQKRYGDDEAEGETMARHDRFKAGLEHMGLGDMGSMVADWFDECMGAKDRRDASESESEWFEREDRPEESGGAGSGEVDDEESMFGSANKDDEGIRGEDRRRRGGRDETESAAETGVHAGEAKRFKAGEFGDRKRGARDSAMALDSFNEMFPWAGNAQPSISYSPGKGVTLSGRGRR